MLHDEHGIPHLYCLDHLLQMVAVVAYDANVLAVFDGEDIENETTTTGPAAETDPNIIGKIVSSEVLKKVRRLVGFFNKSTQARTELQNIQKEQAKTTSHQVDIIQDVVTRWWSTLAMLDRLFHLRESLIIYASRHPFPKASRSSEKSVEMLSHDEWEALDMLRAVLEPFKVAQKILEGNKYVTSSLVVHIVYSTRLELKSLLQSSCKNQSIVKLVEKMTKKFDEIFGTKMDGNNLLVTVNDAVQRGFRNRQVGLNKALFYAHILDPRFKNHRPAGMSKHTRSELWSRLEDEAVKIVWAEEERKKRGDRTTEIISDSSDDDDPEVEVLSDNNLQQMNQNELFWWKYAKIYQSSGASDADDNSNSGDYDSCHDRCATEIRRYRKAKTPLSSNMSPDLNILEWWKVNREEFPIVWKLAQLYLAIPASAASSERAFSIAGNIVTSEQNRLNSELVEAVHLLHENAWLIREQRKTFFSPQALAIGLDSGANDDESN